MDGLPSLEKVFKEEFSEAKVQRCQVHAARNIMSKVPRSLKAKANLHKKFDSTEILLHIINSFYYNLNCKMNQSSFDIIPA